MSASPTPPPRQRLRLRYRKDEVLMYTGHLDLLRLVVRWLRRAEAPFATSGKFSPKPRLTFGPVLPLGVLGDAELLDLELEGEWLDPNGLDCLLARLREISAPRDFAQQLTALRPDAPSIASVAALAQYVLEYRTADAAGQALGALQTADLDYTAKSGRLRSDREAILALGLAEATVRVLGRCAGESQVNILRLARAAASLTGVMPLRQRREALLDSRQQPL